MLAIYLSPFYILLCLYLFYRMLKWMGECHAFFRKRWAQVCAALLYGASVFSILFAFFVGSSGWQRRTKVFGNYWLGVLLHSLFVVILADSGRRILKRTSFSWKEKFFTPRGHIVIGSICLALITALTAEGIAGAEKIQLTDYQVNVDKNAGKLEALNVVLLADLHLGYNSSEQHIKEMVKKVNKQNPDLIVIAGDIFDNEYEALDNPDKLASVLSHMKSKYGVYACYGNHDIQEKILAGFTFSHKEKKKSDPRMDAFLKKAGIHLLRDEGVCIDGAFYLYGRADYERPGRGIEKRKSPEEFMKNVDQTMPVLVLDHEPRELKELASAGVDLDLCGHTHAGQTFPGNLLMPLLWKNPCGYLKQGNMHNIVTSGIGTFGPNMRLGTKAEICRIQIKFHSES